LQHIPGHQHFPITKVQEATGSYYNISDLGIIQIEHHVIHFADLLPILTPNGEIKLIG
jgi:hypothetical protein